MASPIPLNDSPREGGATLLRHVVKNLLGFGGTAGTDRKGDAAVATVVDSIADWYGHLDGEGVHGAETPFYLGRAPASGARGWAPAFIFRRGCSPDPGR